MNVRILIWTAVVVAGLTSVTAQAVPPSEDLGWIGAVPGVSLNVSASADETQQHVYQVAGDVDAAFANVRKGLTDRGWSVGKTTSVNAIATTVRTAKASKGSAAISVVVTGVPGASTMSVTVERGSVAFSASAVPSRVAPSPAATAPATPPPAKRSGGADIVIMTNHVKGRYDCNGRSVEISANHARVFLSGACVALRVIGNHNRVRVEGTIESIDVPGNENDVKWTAANQPTPPRVSNLGNENTISD